MKKKYSTPTVLQRKLDVNRLIAESVSLSPSDPADPDYSGGGDAKAGLWDDYEW